MDNLDHMMSTTLMLEDGQEEEEEVLCSRVMDKKVPRLPVIASVYKFKQLEKRDGKHRGRGRASMLRTYGELRPGKQAVVQKSDETKSMALKRHSPSPDMEPTPQCNGHWRNEEFPQLGTEPQISSRQAPKQTMSQTGSKDSTVPIQPKMMKLTGATSSTCDTERTNRESIVETDTSQSSYSLTHNDLSHNVVKPKTKKMEKVNYAEHYKNILMEFQSISGNSTVNPKRVMSLTKANLERHAREMDSSDLCKIRSASKSTVENVGNQSADDQMEAYEKYQVTLDDIQRFKHHQSQVPSNVKGMLASLLNDETDNCIKDNPAVGVDKDVMGLESENQMLDCAINDAEQCAAEDLGSEGRVEGSDKERLNAIGTNDSMLSNLSDNELFSDDIYQSDTEENYCNDNNNAYMQEKSYMSTTSQLDEFKLERKEIVNEQKRTEEKDWVILDGNIQGNGEVSVNDYRKETEDTDLKSDSQLNDIDVLPSDCKVNDELGAATSNDQDLDLEDFQEVKYKHHKKKKSSRKGSPELVYSSKKGKAEPDNTIWRLYGPRVIQISGLPADFDATVLLEVVGGFGQITDYQVRCIDNGCSVRVEFHSEDDGDYAVETLHDTDCLFADADCVLQCEKLKY